MKKTKPYWYHDTAYSTEPYFVCLDFSNLPNALVYGLANPIGCWIYTGDDTSAQGHQQNHITTVW